MTGVYAAFMMMYYILDAASDEMDSEVVQRWAMEANPFLFRDIGSADPAIYIEFKREWDGRYGKDASVGEAECKTFLREYLVRLAPDCLDAFATVVDDASWERDLRDVQKQAEGRRADVSGLSTRSTVRSGLCQLALWCK